MKTKLTPAETMLVSIAKTEREQAIQQINAIYEQRMLSLLQTHGLTWQDAPEIKQDGQDYYLETPAVPLPKSNGSAS